MIRIFFVALFGVISLPVFSFADDVTDQINIALRSYLTEDYSNSIVALDTATTLVRQKRSESVAKVLPEKFDGWEAGETKSASFAGMISVTRSYTKGEKVLEAAISVDSPMIQAVSSLLTNPTLMGEDRKLKIINGRKVIYDMASNSYMTIVEKSSFIKLEGSPSVEEKDLLALFEAIDIEKLEKLSK